MTAASRTSTTRRALGLVAATTIALGFLASSAGFASVASAASAAAPAISSPPPAPTPGTFVYDPDHVLRPETLGTAEDVLDLLQSSDGIRLYIDVARVAAGETSAQATTFATNLAAQWKLNRAVLFVLSVEPSRCAGQAAFARGSGVTSTDVADSALADVATSQILPSLRSCDPDTAILGGEGQLVAQLIGSSLGNLAPFASFPPITINVGPNANAGLNIPPAGPPYPDPTVGRYVYDEAGVFSAATIASVQATIEGIRTRTGAEVVVYTQEKPGVDTDQAEQDANDLLTQWGVGRRGFDDGLVILFDLDQTLKHGQVQLYAGSGYAAAFLSNDERQSIYQDDMLPLLKSGDLDGALLAAMTRIDANATPEHAATLEQARQANAVIGLVGAPLALVLLVGWALWSWLRYGRDPHYLDDASILMPAPPDDLTPASGALVFDGRSTRHTLTTAMLDLASRGEIAFRPEHHTLGNDRVSIDITSPDPNDARVALNRRPALGPAETYALGKLQDLATPDTDGKPSIDSTALLAFGPSVVEFNKRLEAHVVQKGWFREAPNAAIQRWQVRGIIETIVGFLGFIVAVNLPSDGLLLISVAVIAAGIVTLFIARSMPARTLAGATIHAMLAAYRRTLKSTLAQARSMDAVVASKALPWLTTPDQAVVWGVALGLRTDIESVIERTADDVRHGQLNPSVAYFPVWFGARGTFGGGGGLGSGIAPGLFSGGSAVPNFGSMFAAIGTIGNSASSSGGGGFGGGGGGGGGGAGGGF